MDLILWRHAEAEDARPGQGDLDRALTPKGRQQAERMAQWLNQRLAGSTRVLASPARRTQQTAQALGRAFDSVAPLAPGAAPKTLLDVAGWPDSPQPVLIVGHQPTLGQLAALLLAGRHRAGRSARPASGGCARATARPAWCCRRCRRPIGSEYPLP